VEANSSSLHNSWFKPCHAERGGGRILRQDVCEALRNFRAIIGRSYTFLKCATELTEQNTAVYLYKVRLHS
jgi:hypothetical protein